MAGPQEDSNKTVNCKLNVEITLHPPQESTFQLQEEKLLGPPSLPPNRTGSLRQGALGSRTTSHFYFRAKNKGCCPRGRGQTELLPARVLGGGFGQVSGSKPGDEGQPTRERRAESWKEPGTEPCCGAADQLLPDPPTLLRWGNKEINFASFPLLAEQEG